MEQHILFHVWEELKSRHQCIVADPEATIAKVHLRILDEVRQLLVDSGLQQLGTELKTSSPLLLLKTISSKTGNKIII